MQSKNTITVDRSDRQSIYIVPPDLRYIVDKSAPYTALEIASENWKFVVWKLLQRNYEMFQIIGEDHRLILSRDR